MATYDRKRREINRSLNRRSRMRRAYFKMLGEDPKATKKAAETDAIDTEIDLSDVSDSDQEDASPRRNSKPKKQDETANKSKKPRGKQLASQKRAEQYHKQKEAELLAKQRIERRAHHKNVMQKRTSRGQPRLGAQMGVLLEKIKKSGTP